MDLRTINDRYGTYIWKIANRYHIGIWAVEDVFNEILLHIHSAINAGKIKDDRSKDTVKRTKSLIITRAIDIIRREKRRRFVHIDDIEAAEPLSRPSLGAVDFEIELIRELLFTELNPRVAAFVFELAFPSYTTIEIAMEEQARARIDNRLRMNISKKDLRILPRHVAKSLSGYGESGVSLSRIMSKARDGLSNYFGRRQVSLQDIVDEILRQDQNEEEG